MAGVDISSLPMIANIFPMVDERFENVRCEWMMKLKQVAWSWLELFCRRNLMLKLCKKKIFYQFHRNWLNLIRFDSFRGFSLKSSFARGRSAVVWIVDISVPNWLQPTACTVDVRRSDAELWQWQHHDQTRQYQTHSLCCLWYDPWAHSHYYYSYWLNYFRLHLDRATNTAGYRPVSKQLTCLTHSLSIVLHFWWMLVPAPPSLLLLLILLPPRALRSAIVALSMVFRSYYHT